MLSRNASPSDLLEAGALNNLRRINIGNNVFTVDDTTLINIRFQQFTRLYGIKLLTVAGNGFSTQITILKDGVSIVKNEGAVAGAVAFATGDIRSINFLDANADKYVDFEAGSVLKISLSNSVGNAVGDELCVDLDLVQG